MSSDVSNVSCFTRLSRSIRALTVGKISDVIERKWKSNDWVRFCSNFYSLPQIYQLLVGRKKTVVGLSFSVKYNSSERIKFHNLCFLREHYFPTSLFFLLLLNDVCSVCCCFSSNISTASRFTNSRIVLLLSQTSLKVRLTCWILIITYRNH